LEGLAGASHPLQRETFGLVKRCAFSDAGVIIAIGPFIYRFMRNRRTSQANFADGAPDASTTCSALIVG
jgi:hypothetical protein